MKATLFLLLASCAAVSTNDSQTESHVGEITSAIEAGPRIGSYYSRGEFNCLFLNSKVTRPFPAHWEITQEGKGAWRLLGASPILNSQPIDMHLVGEKLFDIDGKQRGSMKCKGGECDVDFEFDSNFPLGGRSGQSYTATWVMDKDGFSESAKLAFHWLPLFGTCYSVSDFEREID